MSLPLSPAILPTNRAVPTRESRPLLPAEVAKDTPDAADAAEQPHDTVAVPTPTASRRPISPPNVTLPPLLPPPGLATTAAATSTEITGRVPAAGTSSSGSSSASTSDAPASAPALETERSQGAVIEMDAIAPAGHRRRRSSLINPANTTANSSRHYSPQPRSHSGAGSSGGGGGGGGSGAGNIGDDSKILEESSEEDGGSRRLGRVEERSDVSDEDLHDDEETGLTGSDRRRKRRKRNRNGQLDQRVVRDPVTAEEKEEADRSVVRQLLVNAVLIGLWYFFSLLISLYNKWMFSPDNLNFPFPMFTTSVHMLVQFSLASLVLFFFPSLRPSNAALHAHHHHHGSDRGRSRHEADQERPSMTKLFYLTRIGPCGVATGLDIGLGNTSLQFITLTFYTMCKSSSLAFVLIFAFLFRLEAPTWRLVAIIAAMTLGVVMMVAGEVEFKPLGFVLVIAAAFFSGFRWALTQILLLRNPATSNPFSSIFFLAPVMFVTLLSIAIPVEGIRELAKGMSEVAEVHGWLAAPLLLLFPGVIAFLMTASEFALLQRTSVVTLSIAGIFKEAMTISAAAVVFGDKMTLINIVGLVVTLLAIGAYNWIKITRMREDAQKTVHRQHVLHEEGLSGSSSLSGSPSSSPNGGRRADGEDAGEDAGLLRRSLDQAEEVLFTADGDVVTTKPDPSPTRAEIRDERRD